MNIEHIKTFLEIAATGNFNRAAERLNVTQSTASARIKTLEDRLDRVLFLRGRNGATLTAAGRRFHRYALSAVRAWEQARQETALPEGYRAYLGLGSQVSLWERLILKWIPWMRQEAPDVALRLEADYSDSLMRRLSEGLLDIGVMYLPRTASGLVIEKLLEERLVLVATSRRSITTGWRDDYVFVDWGTDYRANINLIGSLIETTFSEENASAILKSRDADGRALMNIPGVLEGLASISRKINPVGQLAPSTGGTPQETLEGEIANLEKFMRDDRKAYNKDEKSQARLRELYQIRIDHEARNQKTA